MIDSIIYNNEIKIIYIISSNYTLLFAEKLRDYYKNNEINKKKCLIYNNIYDSLINKVKNNKNSYLLFIGTIILIKNNITYLPYQKYIIYQIEQLNQNLYFYNNLSSNIINLIINSYEIYDYSIVNLNYYPQFIKKNVKFFIPFVPNNEKCINESYINEKCINEKCNKNQIKNILFIGTLNKRREKILKNLKKYIFSHNLPYNLQVYEKLFGSELKDTIQNSSVVLNLHYYDNAILEVFRIEDILFYNKKIISERPGNNDELFLIEKYEKNNLIEFIPIIEENNNCINIEHLYNYFNTINNYFNY